MKILVAFKVCPDLDKLRPEDLIVQKSLLVDIYFLPNMLNCYDESALELALRAREGCAREPIVLSALTIGEKTAEEYLKTLKALGYDHTVRVACDEAQMRFRPEAVAHTVARYAAAFAPDLILVGREAPLGNNGAVGPFLSAYTGYPLYSPVTDFSLPEDGTVRVCTSREGKTAVWTAKTPCILCVGNAAVSKLRVPSLRMRMQCRESVAESWTLSEPACSLHGSPDRLEIPQRRREGYASPARGEQAVVDIERHALKERLERI